jgi:uncharacterized membrane protein
VAKSPALSVDIDKSKASAPLETWMMWNHARTVASLLASALVILTLALTRSP